jgi:hypothetical protein
MVKQRASTLALLIQVAAERFARRVLIFVLGGSWVGHARLPGLLVCRVLQGPSGCRVVGPGFR